MYINKKGMFNDEPKRERRVYVLLFIILQENRMSQENMVVITCYKLCVHSVQNIMLHIFRNCVMCT